MKRANYKTRKGFSLAEAMMATVVLGIAAAGVLLPFVSGASVRAEGVHRTLAAKLAGDLMEQIVRTPVIGTYTPELKGQIKDATGAVFTDLNYANFSRDAICQNVYVPQESGTGQPRFILATVRVYYNDKEIAVISRLISK